jgi:hypothetical protein
MASIHPPEPDHGRDGDQRAHRHDVGYDQPGHAPTPGAALARFVLGWPTGCSRSRGSVLMRPAPASQSQHVPLNDNRNGFGRLGRERKQRRRRSLVPCQRALKNSWLIDDVAATEVAHRDDQPCARLAVAKIELDGIRRAAAVPSSGCAQNQRRSSRTISSSARAIATVPQSQVCRQPLRAGTRLPDPTTPNLQSITAD